MKILMVLTSHDELGNTGRKTGFWLEEFAAPYFTFLTDAVLYLTDAATVTGQILYVDGGAHFGRW